MEDVIALGINAKHSNEDTIAPFTRFVRAEEEKLVEQRDRLVGIESQIAGLQAILGDDAA